MLSDDVDNEDEDGQRRYKRQILRELYAGMHNRHIRTWDGDYRCPFLQPQTSWRVCRCCGACKRTSHWLLQAKVFSQSAARRVHQVPGEASGSCRQMRWVVGSKYVHLSMLNDGWTMYLWLNYACVRFYVWVCLIYIYLCLNAGYGCNQFGWWNLPPS